jgi:hypothetical protein
LRPNKISESEYYKITEYFEKELWLLIIFCFTNNFFYLGKTMI